MFVTGVLWIVAARVLAMRAANGITDGLSWGAANGLLTEAFFLFLLLVGFAALSWIGMRQAGLREVNALPKRSTSQREWAVGAVIGWAALLLTVLPMMLTGSLFPEFFWTAGAWGSLLLSVIAVALASLASEVAYRGFVFRRLIEAIGPTAATLLLAGIYALLESTRPNATGLSFVVAMIAGILFSLAYLRTHALWMGWGLHFAWAAATTILFGLPLGGAVTYSSVVQTDVAGPAWLTGGAYGPDGALFTAIVFLLALVVLYRATRDYAWHYTQPVIVPGGYPMDVPPSPAHAAMEQGTRPPELVQIAPAPQGPEASGSPGKATDG